MLPHQRESVCITIQGKRKKNMPTEAFANFMVSFRTSSKKSDLSNYRSTVLNFVITEGMCQFIELAVETLEGMILILQ